MVTETSRNGEEMMEFKAGWWLNRPSEKYESQLGLLFPIYGKIKHVPNHQPERVKMSVQPETHMDFKSVNMEKK